MYFYTIDLGTSRIYAEANIFGGAESVSIRGEGAGATLTEKTDDGTGNIHALLSL